MYCVKKNDDQRPLTWHFLFIYRYFSHRTQSPFSGICWISDFLYIFLLFFLSARTNTRTHIHKNIFIYAWILYVWKEKWIIVCEIFPTPKMSALFFVSVFDIFVIDFYFYFLYVRVGRGGSPPLNTLNLLL